jgi:hypothetical protein
MEIVIDQAGDFNLHSGIERSLILFQAISENRKYAINIIDVMAHSAPFNLKSVAVKDNVPKNDDKELILKHTHYQIAVVKAVEQVQRNV